MDTSVGQPEVVRRRRSRPAVGRLGLPSRFVRPRLRARLVGGPRARRGDEVEQVNTGPLARTGCRLQRDHQRIAGYEFDRSPEQRQSVAFLVVVPEPFRSGDEKGRVDAGR